MIEKLEDIRHKYEEIRTRLTDPDFVQDHRAVREAQKTLTEFEPIIAKTEEHRRLAGSSKARGSSPSRSRRETSSTRWPRPRGRP